MTEQPGQLKAATTAQTVYTPEKARDIIEEAFVHEVNGVKMKTVFKDNLCRSDKFGRPVMYWDPKTKTQYVIRIAAKGQSCRILKELRRGKVEVDYILVSHPDKNGNRQYRHKIEKVDKDCLEEVPINTIEHIKQNVNTFFHPDQKNKLGKEKGIPLNELFQRKDKPE